MRLVLKACVLFFAIILIAGPSGKAQIKVPKPPEMYDVHLHYRIQADRNERVLQFEAMIKHFAKIGFKENVTEESESAPFDPNAEMMAGTIPSNTARDLLLDRRVKTILLAPLGFMPPEDPQTRVRVLLDLARSSEQLLLFKQIEVALGKLDFQKDIGFDTRQFTVMRGTIPFGNTMDLLRDLRYQPSGWFLPETDGQLYAKLPDGAQTPMLAKPFGDREPIRVIEILGGVEASPMIVTLPPIPAEQAHLAKLTADLRRKLAEAGVREQPLRLEVVLTTEPRDLELEWRFPFIRAGVEIEGRVGPVVTVQVPKGAQAEAIAAFPDVSSVRLPRKSRTGVPTPAAKPKAAPGKEDNKLTRIGYKQDQKLPERSGEIDWLKQTGVDRLRAFGQTGKKISIVVLDSDFAGWETLVPKEEKPSHTVKFLDLTAERNKDVRPEPMPGKMGHGTQCARAVQIAAPDADLTLIRIPTDAPYHLINVARSIRGDLFRTEGLVTRRMEIEAEQDSIRNRRILALDEYRKAFNDFSDSEPERKRRIAAQNELKTIAAEITALRGRLERVEQIEYDLAQLVGTRVVLSMQSWPTGFALDAASAVSRYLDAWLIRSKTDYVRQLGKPLPVGPPLWFQPAGDTAGQAWTGLFRDADKNGVLEYAGPEEDLKPGRWSRELNFLAAKSDGKSIIDLTAGTKLRINVQWREPHDPTLPEEDFRTPVVPLKLQLVKQRDPSGQKYASDEIDLIAESEGVPARLHIESRFGVYEHSLELTLPADGRYAVRLEGRLPDGIRPANVPFLEDQAVTWELRPRVFVDSADGQTRLFLSDYSSANGGVSVPADARAVFAIGAAGSDGKAVSSSASGAGPETALAVKPDLLGPNALPGFEDSTLQETELAAAYTAGWAAAMLSAGLPAASFPKRLEIEPGSVIAMPSEWLRR